MLLDVSHHLHDLEVRASVTGAFQGTERCRKDGVAVRPGGRHNPVREGGVVAAAMFHVQNKADVQKPRLQIGVFAVLSQHLQNVLCK